MSTEQNKAIVRRIVGEAVPGRDADMLGELYAPNYVCYGLNGESMDRQTTLQFAHMMMTAFPDMQVTIHHQIAEDDTVANRYTWKTFRERPS